MKDLFKRLTAASIAAMMLPAAGVSATAENEDGDELVTFIVQTAAGTPTAVLKAELRSEGTMSAESINAQAEASDEHLEAKNREILEKAAEMVGTDAGDESIFTQLNSGFTVTARRSDRDRLLSMSGVLTAEEALPMEVVPGDEISESISPVTSEINDTYRGQGTLIAVIDSGFKVAHDYFKEQPAVVRYDETEAQALITERKHGAYYSAKIPYIYDYYEKTSSIDSVSNNSTHGTHVAGIAAGKNGITPDNTIINGTAPEAQLALMSCGSSEKAISETAYLDAINDAAALGADVINMSFGSAYTDTRSSSYTAQRTAMQNAVKAGIVVCTSAGNSGWGFYNRTPLVTDLDYGTGGNWANITDTFSVASADTAEYYARLTDLQLSNNTVLKGKDIEVNKKYYYQTVTQTLSVVYCGLGREEDLTGKDLTGKVALMQRGENTFSTKTDNAKKKGAVAAIVYDNIDEAYPSVGGFTLPSIFMTKADGEALAAALAADSTLTVTATGQSDYLLENSTTAGKPSDFSSWGVTDTLELVPNIMGFGGNVYSADSANTNGYISMSGTSMSSPYLAGICASVKSYLNLQPYAELENVNMSDLIKQLTASSALPVRDSEGIAYSPRQQGAGMASVNRAIAEPVTLFNDKGRTLVNLGEGIGDSFTLSFTAHNYSDIPITFDSISVEASTDGSKETNGEYYVDGRKRLSVVSYTNEPITVPARGDAEVSIDVRLDAAELETNREIFTKGFYIDGFVSLSGGGVTAGLPFTGFAGSWGDMRLWDKSIYDKDGSALTYDDPKTIGTLLGTTVLGKQATLSRDRMIISPANDDLYYDTLTVWYTPYRSSHDVTLELTGEKTYSSTRTGYSSKFKTYSYSFVNPEQIEEGEYTVTLKGSVDNGTTRTYQTMTFPDKLIVDNTPPQISQTLSADGDALGVSVSDEYFVREIRVDYTDRSGNAQSITKSLDCTKTAEEHSFTLTDAAPETISVTACDYAYNTAVSGIEAPAASYELIRDEYVSDTMTDNNASLWQVTVNCGSNTVESISVRVNGKSPRDDKKIERNFTNTAVVFGVVVSAFADKVTDMKAIVNGNEVETTRSDTVSQSEQGM